MREQPLLDINVNFPISIGHGASKHLKAETPPDRYGLFLCPVTSGRSANYLPGVVAMSRA